MISTVIITNYNYAPYLNECIESVLNQSSPVDQIICVDDGSLDNSLSVLREFDEKIKIIAKNNSGQLAAMIDACSEATGDIIFFLDADDYWHPEHCELILNEFREDDELLFASSSAVCFGLLTGEHPLGQMHKKGTYQDTSLLTYYGKHFIGMPTSCLALERGLLLRLLSLSSELVEDFKLCSDEVLVYGASLLHAKKIFLPWHTTHYRVHSGNSFFKGGDEMSTADTQRRDMFIELLASKINLSKGLDAVVAEVKLNGRWHILRRYYKPIIKQFSRLRYRKIDSELRV